MGRDVATLFVAIALAAVLATVAYVRLLAPRHDAWQPEELSTLPGAGMGWFPLSALGAQLAPPFPSPTNGKNHV